MRDWDKFESYYPLDFVSIERVDLVGFDDGEISRGGKSLGLGVKLIELGRRAISVESFFGGRILIWWIG